MSDGTRAPEVQKEIEIEEIEQATFRAGYATGMGYGIAARVRALSDRNMGRGVRSNVTLNITFSVGVWYLRLEDATNRVVTFAHEDLGIALEEILR